MLTIVLLSCFLVVFITGFIYFLKGYLFLRHKYSAIIDLDAEVEKQKEAISINNNEIENLRNDYAEKRKVYDNLVELTNLLNDDLEMMEVGLYQPSYNFDTSETYKVALNQNYEAQKREIKTERAVTCPINWTVDGSVSKGKQMIKKQSKLMLKAFNGECDANIAKVKWNNFDRMKARISKAFEDINKLGESHNIKIQRTYLKLKIEELKLTYEYEQKKYDEKEEQKRIREQIREEEKLQKELEREQKKIEEQQERELELQELQKQAFEQGKQEEAQKYTEEIERLKEEIERRTRKMSEAQKTKTGHVYVISNIGSFGENIYKIGMTRRLEPQERVDELGDASVPFKFDVHAMIHSENAPELENRLHEIFKNKSVNRINYRKEFFNVTLEEIENAVKEYTNNAEISFTKIAEAREYRETQAIKKAERQQVTNSKQEDTKIPEFI